MKKFLTKITAFILMFGCVITFVACGGGGNTTPDPLKDFFRAFTNAKGNYVIEKTTTGWDDGSEDIATYEIKGNYSKSYQTDNDGWEMHAFGEHTPNEYIWYYSFNGYDWNESSTTDETEMKVSNAFFAYYDHDIAWRMLFEAYTTDPSTFTKVDNVYEWNDEMIVVHNGYSKVVYFKIELTSNGAFAEMEIDFYEDDSGVDFDVTLNFTYNITFGTANVSLDDKPQNIS